VLRFTTRSAIELAVAAIFGFLGLLFLLGTVDEYKSGRAFNRAMDSYAAHDLETLYDALQASMAAKPSYTAPQEVYGKLLIDEGYTNPPRFAEAAKLFRDLAQRQEARGGKASLPARVGVAVADLEAARASNPAPEALADALRQARSRLEEALRLYPDSGDLHVNLATIALLENHLSRCKEELELVNEAGNLSIDALPLLYNLSGLVALREGRIQQAAREFQKVEEFAPDWDAPYLNLAAAQAQGLLSEKTDPRVAADYAASASRLLDRLRKSKSPIYPLVAQALASYYVRVNAPSEALNRFRAAEEGGGQLTWHGRFNKAIAEYLVARAARRSPAQYNQFVAAVRPVFAQAVASPKSTRRDLFVASCILGTLDDEAGKPEAALAHFERAADIRVGPSDVLIREAMPRVHLSLAALYYKTNAFQKAIEQLEKASGSLEENRQIAALLKQLRTPPVVSQFSVRHEKIFTDYDLRVSAQVVLPASPRPLEAEDVTLTLCDALSGSSRPLPFRLDGPVLHAVALNLPQGRYSAKITVADAIGNHISAASDESAFDREPPRVLEPSPAPGASTRKLDLIRFRLHDAISAADLSSLSVSLRYPSTSALAVRSLITRGKYLYASADGTVNRNSAVTSDVQCPVPPPTPPGQYRVIIRVQDTKGKVCDLEWPFTLAP